MENLDFGVDSANSIKKGTFFLSIKFELKNKKEELEEKSWENT